jgi:hypothetical protein
MKVRLPGFYENLEALTATFRNSIKRESME